MVAVKEGLPPVAYSSSDGSQLSVESEVWIFYDGAIFQAELTGHQHERDPAAGHARAALPQRHLGLGMGRPRTAAACPGLRAAHGRPPGKGPRRNVIDARPLAVNMRGMPLTVMVTKASPHHSTPARE
ncbi:hypothetical protein SUDANB108_07013 [Streptomyces sp. enrichment culture]